MTTALICYANGSEDIEVTAPANILTRGGVKVTRAAVCAHGVQVTLAHGTTVLCDKNIANCDFFDASLIVLPGGLPGATTLAECKELGNLILKFAEEKKPMAAICAAPMVFGKLGVLKGKKATCYPGFDKYLEGAEYTGAMVERDGNIVTGKGPGASIKFALALVELMVGKEKVKELEEAMCIR